MSEGHQSAERIERFTRNVHPYPTTVPDLELQETGAQRVRRVLSPQQCRPGVCEGLATCNDVHCEGHPCNTVTREERDPIALRWALGGYFLILALLGLIVGF